MIIKSATPINRPVQPKYHEGSSLRSPTDSDSLMRSWTKDVRVAGSTFGLTVQVAKLSRELGKLRRRVLGGLGTQAPTTPTAGTYLGNFGSGTPYSAGVIVRNLISTFNIMNVNYNVQLGVYGCVANTVPALAVGWNPNMLPQYPEPTTGIIYWHLISFAPEAVNVCSNGSRIIYVQSSGTF